MLGNELLSGDIVHFVPTTPEDAQYFEESLKDSAKARYLTHGNLRDVTPQAWYKHFTGALDFRFAIQRKRDDRFIGIGGLGNIHWQARHATMGLAMCDDAYWCDGTALDTVQVLLRYAFMEINLNRVALRIPSFHQEFADVIRSSDWHDEGSLRETHFLDDQMHDTYMFGMLRREWQTMA